MVHSLTKLEVLHQSCAWMEGKQESLIQEENAFMHTMMGYVGLSYAISTKLPPVAELE